MRPRAPAVASRRLAVAEQALDALGAHHQLNLPLLLQQLIRGVDNPRANLSRICADTARHLAAGPDNPALPSDLAAAKKLIPAASLEWLAERMAGLDDARRGAVIAAADELLRAGD